LLTVTIKDRLFLFQKMVRKVFQKVGFQNLVKVFHTQILTIFSCLTHLMMPGGARGRAVATTWYDLKSPSKQGSKIVLNAPFWGQSRVFKRMAQDSVQLGLHQDKSLKIREMKP